MSNAGTKDNGGTENLAMHEIVAIAAFLAGGDRKHVDTEDIAVKANEVAPGRFSWRKYRDQIDLEAIYKHLWDLTKPDKGSFVEGSKHAGWLMTKDGIDFAERTVGKLPSLRPAREKRPKSEEKWIKRERDRMLSEPAYGKARDGRFSDITLIEAQKFFRLDDYVVGAVRTRKLQQAEMDFRDDPELGPAVQNIAAIVREAK